MMPLIHHQENVRMAMTYLGGVECQEAGFAVSEEYLQTVILELVPAFVDLLDVLLGQRHEQDVTVA